MKTIRFAVSNWPGHLAGQHADVRLTAEDGYRAERSYSIASPPEVSALELTVERLDDGEVSPFLTGQLQPDDTIQLRGPIGGHFVWSAFERRHPLLLVGGGSGIVPLMCMLRHRRLSGSAVPAALLYSARTREDVIYHEELTDLARSDPRFTLRITLTRDSAPGWSGSSRAYRPAGRPGAAGRPRRSGGQLRLRFRRIRGGGVCPADAGGTTARRDPHRAVWANRNVAQQHVDQAPDSTVLIVSW